MSHKAWQNAHAMYENDACAKALGIDIISMDEGFAVVERPNGFLEETILSRVDSFKEVTFLTMRSATG